MSTISRQLPRTNITRRKALLGFAKGMTLPSATSLAFPSSITSLLATLPGNYDSKFLAEEVKEGLGISRTAKKNIEQERLRTVVVDFLAVLSRSINRSLLFEDGLYFSGDEGFYNLDQTGGNLPNPRSIEDIYLWANYVLSGEAERLAAHPGAPGMSNPGVAEIVAQKTLTETAEAAQNLAQDELFAARQAVEALNAQADQFILTAWNFLESNYSTLEPETLRARLREFGVIYASQGTANTLSLLVRNPAGQALVGAKAVLAESGASALANAEGRIELETRYVGDITLRISFPGLITKDVNVNIPDDAEGQTFDLGIVDLSQ